MHISYDFIDNYDLEMHRKYDEVVKLHVSNTLQVSNYFNLLLCFDLSERIKESNGCPYCINIDIYLWYIDAKIR
jgi:hypothetical protein